MRLETITTGTKYLPGPLDVASRAAQRADIAAVLSAQEPARVAMFNLDLSVEGQSPTFHSGADCKAPPSNRATQPPLNRTASWLANAEEDLDCAEDEAIEAGFQPSADIAKQNARRILTALAHYGLPVPAIYPTADREIAIYFRNQARGDAVLILCDSNGGGACFASVVGKNSRVRYEDASEMPDAFTADRLRKLK